MPDRSISPGLLEYKKVIEPVETISIDLENGIIKVIKSGRLSMSDIPGKESKQIKIPYSLDFKKISRVKYILCIKKLFELGKG